MIQPQRLFNWKASWNLMNGKEIAQFFKLAQIAGDVDRQQMKSCSNEYWIVEGKRQLQNYINNFFALSLVMN